MIDCTGCTECCNWMTFIVRLDPDMKEANIAFYKARGCVITPEGESVAIAIPSPCPHLITGGCGIYEERPLLCASYDCRQDPFLPKGKYKD